MTRFTLCESSPPAPVFVVRSAPQDCARKGLPKGPIRVPARHRMSTTRAPEGPREGRQTSLFKAEASSSHPALHTHHHHFRSHFGSKSTRTVSLFGTLAVVSWSTKARGATTPRVGRAREARRRDGTGQPVSHCSMEGRRLATRLPILERKFGHGPEAASTHCAVPDELPPAPVMGAAPHAPSSAHASSATDIRSRRSLPDTQEGPSRTEHFTGHGMDFTTILPNQAYTCNLWRLTPSCVSALQSRVVAATHSKNPLIFTGPHNRGADATHAISICCIFWFATSTCCNLSCVDCFALKRQDPRGTLARPPNSSNTVQTRRQ